MANGRLRTIDLLEYCDKPYHHKPRRQRAAPRCRALPLVGLDRKLLTKLPLACRASARRQAHKPRKRRSLPTTSRLLGASPTTGANASGQGALSRRYPRVLQAKRPGSVLSYVTRALSAARRAGASENAPLIFFDIKTGGGISRRNRRCQWQVRGRQYGFCPV